MLTLPTHVHVKRVYRVWRQATSQEREHGALWYADARDLAASLAQAHGKSLKTVAGIIAALSPSVSWERNIDYARELLATGDVARYTGYSRQKQTAIDVYAGDDPDERLGGEKVRAFYRLIRDGGNEYDVCVDGHATNMLLGRLGGIQAAPSLKPSQYAAARACFQAVADKVRRPAYEVQAVTWLAWRRQIAERG